MRFIVIDGWMVLEKILTRSLSGRDMLKMVK